MSLQFVSVCLPKVSPSHGPYISIELLGRVGGGFKDGGSLKGALGVFFPIRLLHAAPSCALAEIEKLLPVQHGSGRLRFPVAVNAQPPPFPSLPSSRSQPSQQFVLLP